METKFFKKLLILTLLICPLAAQAAGKRALKNISNTNVQKQQETNKKNKGQFVCDECGKSYDYPGNLNKHQKNHESKRTGKYKFNCDVEDCNFKTNEFEYSQSHAMNHVSERTGEYKFNCLPCDYKTNRSSHFKVHEQGKKHKKNIAQAGTTTTTDTTTDSNLPTYLELIASEDNLAAAQAAGKRVLNDISGGPEQQETNKKNKGQFVCAEYENSYDSLGDLNRHKGIHESKRTGKWKFNCDECRKNFTNAFHLKLHKADHESARTGVHIFNCDECGNYKTNRSSHYKLHKAYHESERTGIWKFNCPLCDCNTNSASDFKNHENTLKHINNMAKEGWATLTVMVPTTSTTINHNVPTAQDLIVFLNSRETQETEVVTESQEDNDFEIYNFTFEREANVEATISTTINPNVPTAQELIDFINLEEPQVPETVTELQEDVFELPLFKPEDNNKPDWFDVLGGDINNQPF